MSSIKPLSLIPTLALTAALSACATSQSAKPEALITPTEQFQLTAQMKSEQLLLTPHAEGLSSAQRAAMYDLMSRWRSASGGPIVVETPVGAADASFQATARIDQFLGGYGVREPEVQFRRYQADPAAPIRVSFPIYQADIPKCGQAWDDLSRPMNRVNSNFGCATTANIAAMIANPADLTYAKEATPIDAARRQFVLEKYREGAITSSAKDSTASSKSVN